MTPEAAGCRTVEIRAFRGTRRSSVYREHILPRHAFVRILAAGERHGLVVLSSLDQPGPHELDKHNAHRVADEAGSLRVSGDLIELDDELAAIAELARWCARASDPSWMKIATPAAR
jgi:hypothetical protein